MSTSDEPIRFAYWVPNVSGGLVTSEIEQRADWSHEYNRKFMIAREAEAKDALREIVAKAKVEAVHGFRGVVTQAGRSTSDKTGTFEDLVRYNDGFHTKLIATRIVEYRKRGVNLMLLGFLHYHEEVEYFGEHVPPIVRQLEADLVPAGV
jgi:dimethylsulfone monooxygenase